MGAEAGQNVKAKLNRAGLERQGVFYFNGPLISAHTIPAQDPDGEENRTLAEIRLQMRDTASKCDADTSTGRVFKHICWRREIPLNTTLGVPSFALGELKSIEAVELLATSNF